MSEMEVRIVQLEPIHVASALGFGDGPEGQAAEKILAFARAKNLLQQTPAPRFFGFNNPSPAAGSPNYGYELWMEVGAQVQGDGDITIKDFPGGLYAVARCKGVEPIPETWKQLTTWLEKKPLPLQQPPVAGTTCCLDRPATRSVRAGPVRPD